MSEWKPPLWLDRLSGAAWRLIVVVASVALIIGLLIGLSSVVLPLVLGLLFASALNPVAVWLRRRNLPPAACAGLAVLLLVALIGAVSYLTVRAVSGQWPEISAAISDAVDKLVDSAVKSGIERDTAQAMARGLGSGIGSITELVVTGIVHVIPIVAAVVTTLLLSFLVTFFYLKDGSAMWGWVVARTGQSADLVDGIGSRVWKTISGFVLGQTAIAALDATFIGLGAVALGVPYALAITMLTFIGAYVPFIGAFLAGLVAVLLAISDGGLSLGLWMLLIVVIVQLLEGNVLQPWIQSKAVRLHPMVVALSVTAGAAIAGFLGILLAVPVTAASLATLSEMRRAGFLGSKNAADDEDAPIAVSVGAAAETTPETPPEIRPVTQASSTPEL